MTFNQYLKARKTSSPAGFPPAVTSWHQIRTWIFRTGAGDAELIAWRKLWRGYDRYRRQVGVAQTIGRGARTV